MPNFELFENVYYNTQEIFLDVLVMICKIDIRFNSIFNNMYLPKQPTKYI